MNTTKRVTLALLAISLFGMNPTLFAMEELGKIAIPANVNYQPTEAGRTLNWLKNDEPYTTEVLTIKDHIFTGKDSNGCEYSAFDDTWAPSLSWSNCSGSTGTHEITHRKGSPWPLKKGSKFSASFRGKNSNGDSWSGVQKCKVNGGVKIRVPAGEFDTAKITCRVEWETKTYWYAPSKGHSVAVKRAHKNKPSRSYLLELVSG